MISTRLVVFVALITAQIHYVLTLNNCTILSILRNKVRTNVLPIQDNILSQFTHSPPYIHGFKQLADDIYLEKSINSVEQSERLSDSVRIGYSTPIRMARVFIDSSESTMTQMSLLPNTAPFAEMTDTMITTDTNNNGSFNTTISYNTMLATNSNITSDDRNTTIALSLQSENNLPLILGLTLGLGIPVSLAILGSLIYYFKIYRPRYSQIGILTNQNIL